MAISIPAKTEIRHVATAREYSQKQTFINSGARAGSYLSQATTLVYDDILRFQKGPSGYFTAAEIADFDYNEFAGNVLWFMDELVGMESDWTKDASPGIVNNTAYGYVQFTEDSVATAVTRYLEHIKRFNSRKDIRDWQPWGIPKGSDMQIPLWLTKLSVAVNRQPNGKPGPGYDHEYELDRLTYDQTIALAFVHLHSAAVSKDSNFRLLSKGDVDATKEIYTRNHHTNPDQATLDRLNTTIQTGRDKTGAIIAGTAPGFFRIHYVPAPTIKSFAKSLPLAQSLNLLYNIISEQIFTDKYKENRDAVKEANGAP